MEFCLCLSGCRKYGDNMASRSCRGGHSAAGVSEYCGCVGGVIFATIRAIVLLVLDAGLLKGTDREKTGSGCRRSPGGCSNTF